MKIHILFKFQEGPYGGGNQFLKALKEYLMMQNTYTDDLEKSDIILFNSNPYALSMLSLLKNIRNNFSEKIIINRMAGPIYLVRNKDMEADKIFFQFNHSFADGTIFQSDWSRKENYRLGLKSDNFESVIINAPNPLIFNREQKQSFSNHRKIRLIATSWSANRKKGFQVYQWLDEHLDFETYEMTFIGNTPVQFKNIRHINPLPSHELAVKLKEHDMFIFASEIEACSNSLLEAMHCGLPAVAFNGSSNVEIIGKGGLLFDKPEEIPLFLKRIADNYSEYQSDIQLPLMEEVGESYYRFMYSIYESVKAGTYIPKRLDWKQYGYIRAMLLKWKLLEKIRKFLPI